MADICYLCGSDEVRTVAANDRYSYVRCAVCGFRRQHPVPREQDFSQLYGADFYAERQLDRPLDQQSRFTRDLVHQRVVVLTEHCGGPGSLLDVGAGTGLFLEAAVKAGWRAQGVEASRTAITVSRGITSAPILSGTLEDVPQDQVFDAITMWDVLEHLPDPRSSLQRAREMLSSRGVIAISLPSVTSVRARLQGDRWRYFRLEYGHICHFSPHTLRMLLTQAGLTPISVRTNGAFNLFKAFGTDPERSYDVLPLRALQALADHAAGAIGAGEHLVVHARR